jgi:hypothetical protein
MERRVVEGGGGKAWRAEISSSAIFIAQFVESVWVWNHCAGFGIVVLVRFHMFLFNRGGERS